MVLVDVQDDGGSVMAGNGPFPREVEFMISALEAGPRPIVDRQKTRRMPYRVRATLKLYSDDPQMPPCLLYTRHIHSRAMGFLTARPLALSHGGVLMIPSPEGQVLQVSCTVLRCREAAPGWYEGAVYFNREQPIFSAERMMS
jgi:hypothetical protein